MHLPSQGKSILLLIAGGIIVTAALAPRAHVVSAADDGSQNSASIPPGAHEEIREVEARIDRYEAFYLKQFNANPPG